MKDLTGNQEENLNKQQNQKQVNQQEQAPLPKQVKAKKQEAPPSLKKLLKETTERTV